MQVIGVVFRDTENTKTYYYEAPDSVNVGDVVQVYTKNGGECDVEVVETKVKKHFSFKLNTILR